MFLTAHSIGARWLILVTMPWINCMYENTIVGPENRQYLIRGNDCCLQCVVDQAAAQPGKWFVVL